MARPNFVLAPITLTSFLLPRRIKKPKTSRYPSLKGTDPKFRRNHRHALHGTMKALVCEQSLAPVELAGILMRGRATEGA